MRWEIPLKESPEGPETGHASLYDDMSGEDDTLSRHVEARTLVRLETAHWTLRKKLAGILVGGRGVVPRDAYDFLSCALESPGDLERAMRIPPIHLQALARLVRANVERDPRWPGESLRERDTAIIRPKHRHLQGATMRNELALLLEMGAKEYCRKAAKRPFSGRGREG